MPGSARAACRRPRCQRHGSALALALLTTAAITACTPSTAEQPRTDDLADPAGAGARTAPEPGGSGAAAPTPRSLGPADAVRTVVIGDEGTAPPDEGAPAWPELLAGTLEGVGIPMSVVITAEDGAGLTSQPSFTDLVAQHAVGSTQLVILFDSHLAGSDPSALAAATAESADAVERAAPDAELVVVGPLSSEAPDEGSTEVLRETTEDAGGTFVDPTLEGWPMDATQAEIASLLRLHLQPTTERLAASGANR